MSFRHKINLYSLSASRQQGVVLVVALFIVALVAAMSVWLLVRNERATYRSILMLRYAQAAFYAQGSIAWAKDQLLSDWQKRKQNRLIDVMPQVAPGVSMNGYQIQSIIYDAQARFNINNVTMPEGQTAFLVLLKAVQPTIEQQKAQQLLQAIIAWITPQANNAPTDIYLKRKPPYRVAHRPMLLLNELRLVNGMTLELYHALSPYLIALPSTTLINIQTAPLPVLMSLSSGLTLSVAKTIDHMRQSSPFTSVDQFLTLDVIKERSLLANQMTTISNYFLLETTVKIEKQTLVLYTLLERISNSTHTNIKILWQSKGSW